MTRLAFDLGTAVKARYLAGDDVNSRKMQDIIKELFNCVVFENDLKWTSYSPKNHAMISEALDYCQQHQLKVRGHTMVWGSWSHVSPKLRAMANDTTGLSEAIANRITSIGSTYAGRLYEWDVINEPNNHHDLMDVLGYDAMSQWFKLAHAADPNAMLYLNETGVPVGGPDADIYNVLEGHVQRLLRTGAPIHGIGMQGHVGWSMNSPEALWQIFDRFAKLGMPIKITEFDTGVTDEALSADYYRDFYTACFAHPSINGILIWGIWESNKLNRPESAIYRPDWSPKPAALALEKLIGQWKTNIDAMTDAQGQLSVKGYCGSYTLQVGDNAASIKKTFELKREGFSDNIQLTKLK
jgi:GH35 family endo-1,4-beta-xylanase